MSVIACRITKRGWEMAADSLELTGATLTGARKAGDAKLFRVNSLTIGGVGWSSENGLMRVFATTHRPAPANTIDAWLRWVMEFGKWVRAETGRVEFVPENEYLIGNGRRIWNVAGLCVARVRDFFAIGAGEDFALTALSCGYDVRAAVKKACELSPYCAVPVVFFAYDKRRTKRNG